MCSTFPAIGLRFTCTFNTFINTQIRFIFFCSIGASSGGKASSIKHTFPSAELITKFESWGVLLFGSLKNQITKAVKINPIVARIFENRSKRIEAEKKIAANLQPSGWIYDLLLLDLFMLVSVN